MLEINLIKSNRGGKITYHGPGQLICYFVIDLKKRKKDIRKFVSIIEKTIIDQVVFPNKMISFEEFLSKKSNFSPKDIDTWFKKFK